MASNGKLLVRKMHNKLPEVSILLLTYNRRQLLERALNSIFKQTFVNYEILLLDDCSTDDTEQFVHSITDQRIRYYRNKENMGPKHGDWWAVHKVIYELMQGKFFIYVCDDDYWVTEHVLENLVNKFHQHPDLSLVFGMHCHIFSEEQKNFPAEFKVPGIKNCYTIKNMFPSGYLYGLDYLKIFSSSPCHKNYLEGASLFSREKMLACGAFKDKLPDQNWQAGYMFKMGVPCVGNVFFYDEPYIVATVLDTAQSFARTHRDHFKDGSIAILQSYQYLKSGPTYKLMDKAKRRQIKNFYKTTLINHLEHWLYVQVAWKNGGKFPGCSDDYFKKIVRLKDTLWILIKNISYINYKIVRYLFLSYV